MVYHYNYSQALREVIIISYIPLSVPADGVKGKTWGPSTGSNNIKARPTIVDTHNRWKAISAPSLEKLPRNLVNVPSVGTVPEGTYFIITQKSLNGLDCKLTRM